MRRQPAVTILMLIIAMILTLPLRAQQTPFTEVQVGNMVRARAGRRVGREADRAARD